MKLDVTDPAPARPVAKLLGAFVIALMVLVGGRASAQPMPDAAPAPDPAPPDAAPSPDAPSADVPPGPGAPETVDAAPAAEPAATVDVSHAPGPAEANGFERAPSTPGVNHLIWIPRIVLLVPRWGFWLIAQPIRLAAWAYEKYHLGYLYKHGLINIDDSFGITPTASIGGGYGLQVGARIVHRDVFGDHERLRVRAGWGGEFSQAYGLSISSGERFGEHFQLEIDARYERRPSDRFYGIGNGDASSTPPPTPIDPTMDPAAFDTRFREELVTGALTADIKATKELSLRLSGALMTRSFSNNPMDPRDILLYYDPAGLVGYNTGLEGIYVEGEVRYDSRRRGSIYQSHAMDATGWLASAYLGKQKGFDDDRSDFYRYGVELQRYFDLFRGSRTLALRALVESVGGTDGGADGKISFVDLPRLGGLEDLRGYQTGRFRDRALTLVSAEYTWDLGNYLAAFMFIDAGRVWHSLRDVELAASGLRAGYGGGIQVHTRSSFVARAQLAVSRDGEFFLQFALSPAFGRRERAGRH